MAGREQQRSEMVEARENPPQVGLLRCDLARCYDGYAPCMGSSADRADDDYLINMEGQVVHVWPTRNTCSPELGSNGNLVYGEFPRAHECA